MLPRVLDAVEVRILGCLLEKEQTTPEYYPLTVNALVAACNQKSNRDPVMELREAEVEAALERLHAEMLAWPSEGARVRRWEHTLDRRLGLDPKAKAVLTVLFLRGPQTPGELRTRTERMTSFASLEETEATLRALAGGEAPLTAELARRPGQKENRWAHLAAGPPSAELAPEDARAPSGPSLVDRVSALEEKTERLERALEEVLAKLRRG